MQPTVVHRKDMRLVAVAAAIAVSVILLAMAWALWPGTNATTGPSGVPITASSASVGMGDLRAAEALGGRAVGMGDLRALEGESQSAARAAQRVGMGDVRADRLPGGAARMAPYVGMGDVHSVE